MINAHLYSQVYLLLQKVYRLTISILFILNSGITAPVFALKQLEVWLLITCVTCLHLLSACISNTHTAIHFTHTAIHLTTAGFFFSLSASVLLTLRERENTSFHRVTKWIKADIQVLLNNLNVQNIGTTNIMKCTRFTVCSDSPCPVGRMVWNMERSEILCTMLELYVHS